MAKLSPEEQKFWYQTFMLEGRMFFPALLEPKAGTNGKLRYETQFAWKHNSNQAEMAKINAFLNQVKAQYY
ncbi:MAG: hypothetical protein EHM20_12920, partial [Alphaproteobacteria bacterium]